MSSYDEQPTQQVRRPEPPPASLPGSLDPLRGHEANGWPQEPDAERFADQNAAAPTTDTAPVVEGSATGVLPLDEIFAAEPTAPAAEPTAAAEAPTWTAMPVVPVRSEPMPMAGRPVPTAYGHGSDTERHDAPAPVSTRLRADASSALAGTRSGVEDWLRRDDNGLMLLTALVAVVLILVIAAVG